MPAVWAARARAHGLALEVAVGLVGRLSRGQTVAAAAVVDRRATFGIWCRHGGLW